MSAILKEDILRGKNKETSGKEKVDKIMSTIVESIETPHAAKMEKREGAVPSESIKSTETEDAFNPQASF